VRSAHIRVQRIERLGEECRVGRPGASRTERSGLERNRQVFVICKLGEVRVLTPSSLANAQQQRRREAPSAACYCPATSPPGLVLDDYTSLHHEEDGFQLADVIQRI